LQLRSAFRVLVVAKDAIPTDRAGGRIELRRREPLGQSIAIPAGRFLRRGGPWLALSSAIFVFLLEIPAGLDGVALIADRAAIEDFVLPPDGVVAGAKLRSML
jgi:hypothetical protein